MTLGASISRRMGLIETVGYWVAQLSGAIVGALLLWWMMRTSPFYSKSKVGLGANGYGANSLLHVSAGGAFLVEVILTTFFVLVVLSLTRDEATVAVSGMGIGIALALVNLIGIPFDGASANPARSFGPAVITAGQHSRKSGCSSSRQWPELCSLPCCTSSCTRCLRASSAVASDPKKPGGNPARTRPDIRNHRSGDPRSLAQRIF